jgi:hypothetical protein
VQHTVMVMTAEDSIEVDCVSVQDSCLVHSVLELQLDFLKVLECTVFEVKRFTVWLVCQVLCLIIRIKHRL